LYFKKSLKVYPKAKQQLFYLDYNFKTKKQTKTNNQPFYSVINIKNDIYFSKVLLT